MAAAGGITEGSLFRSITKAGRVWGGGMTPKVLWEIVREHLSGGELDQIQFMLGPHFHPDHRAVSRVQTEVPRCGQRPDEHRAHSETDGNQQRAGSSAPW